jgi:RNA polymerase sigma factor (sigma-70 family)
MVHQISRRSVLAFVMTALIQLQGETTSAFSLQTPLSSAISSTVMRGPAPLHMAAASSASPRLTRDEETDLLRQTTEMYRIKTLETDLSVQNRQLPLLSIRTQAAGYGDDLQMYESAMDAGNQARETLVTCNMGLVHYCVNEIWKRQPKSRLGLLSREDLIQEGAIGLQRAVVKYNIGIGGKFSSYAVYWIRASVLRCIAERGDLVRVPEHVSAAIRKMSSAANRLGLQVDGDYIAKGVFANNEQPWKEAQAAKVLAEEAGLTDRQLREAMRVKYRRVAGSVSFEDWMQRGELQSDVTTNSDSTAASVDSEKLRVELSKYLRPKEMEALTLRFGLEDAPAAQEEVKANNYQAEAELLVFGEEPPKRKKSGEMTFNEIGKSMSVSAEYGRRLVHKALSKLQKAAAEGQLEPALLF